MGLFFTISDKRQWDFILESFKKTDVYYSFDYGNLFASRENGKLLAAYYEDESSKVFYPFIKRKVEWDKEEMFDIVSPYGYGGPLLEGSCDSLEIFYKYFTDYCKENNILTETIRFHPIYKNHEQCMKVMEVKYIRKTTAVDLTMPLDEIRKQYSTMNKRNIKKARSKGLFCFLAEKNQENIQTFIEMYKETMNRNQADEYYYFEEKYFYEQLNNTEISESFLLFAKYEEEIIAGVIVLKGEEFSHYHLGASRTSFLHLKPNNLLFDFMIEFCQLKGSTHLHLGGGYSEYDGLFEFKSSFTNQNHYDYYIGKRVYDEIIYDQIKEDVKSRFKVNEEYFPIYRGRKESLFTS